MAGAWLKNDSNTALDSRAYCKAPPAPTSQPRKSITNALTHIPTYLFEIQVYEQLFFCPRYYQIKVTTPQNKNENAWVKGGGSTWHLNCGQGFPAKEAYWYLQPVSLLLLAIPSCRKIGTDDSDAVGANLFVSLDEAISLLEAHAGDRWEVVAT